MKIKYLYLLFLLFFITGQTHAQSVKPTSMRKFIYQTSLGYANGFGQIHYGTNRILTNAIPTFRIQQQLGYQFNPYLSIGVGAGIDIWKKNAFIPIFGIFNVNFTKKRIVPHLYMSGGYAFKWYITSKPDPVNRVIHATRPGPYSEGGLGVKIVMTDRLSLTLDACYYFFYSQINYSVKEQGQPDHSHIATNRYDKVPYHFAGVKFGLVY